MKNLIILAPFLAGAALSFGACTDDPSVPGQDNTPPAGSTSGDQGTTFDHDNDGISPWDLIDRIEKEGPPKYTARMHGCSKMHVSTLGNVLASVGVDIATVGTQQLPSAGDLYKSGANALGQSNYANRIRENLGITTSGSSREFDIFAAAAPQVIANIGTLARCKDAGGNPAQLFDENSACLPSGISCLLGVPATTGHLDYCNLTIQNASDATSSDHTLGKQIAVAALLAAAYTCE